MRHKLRLAAAWLLLGLGVGACGAPAEPAAPAAPAPVWQAVDLPAAAGKTLRGICFVDDRHGWIVGDAGLCLTTADAGASWTAVDTGSDAVLRAVRFNDAAHGFICGDGDSAAPNATGHVVFGLRPIQCGTLLTTADGGQSWQKKWLPCNFEIWCVEASAAPTLQVGVGCPQHLDGDITRSTDGGDHWKERRIYRSLADIRAVDAEHWVAVGSPVSVGFTGVIRDPAYTAKGCRAVFSGDGGKTWAPAQGSDGRGVLRALCVLPDGPIVAVGDHGELRRSEDYGATWKTVRAPQDQHLRAVAAAPRAQGASPGGMVLVAVGRYGRFIVSLDGGQSWRAAWTGQEHFLNGVAACGGRFWAIGADGCVLRAEAQALADARTLLPAPPPPKPAPKVEPPVKPPTAAQRARLRVGDYVVYDLRQQIPAARINTQCRIQRTVTAIDGDRFTVRSEVLEGTPPPGTPVRSEERLAIAGLDDYSALAVGAGQEEKTEQATYATRRQADETVTVKEQALNCLRTHSEAELPNGMGHHVVEQWMCVGTVPVFGVVKSESRQRLPVGNDQVVVRTETLLDWGHAEKKSEAPAAGGE